MRGTQNIGPKALRSIRAFGLNNYAWENQQQYSTRNQLVNGQPNRT